VKRLTLEVDGKPVSGTVAQGSDGILWVHLAGETFSCDLRPQRQGKRKKSTSSIDSSEIAAPMPGKIIKLNVQKGDAASVGQVLIVMEAMKMEYTLKASGAGKIDEVLCKSGDQVELGQALMRLELK
jgi:biotin carboxyl carrier protein